MKIRKISKRILAALMIGTLMFGLLHVSETVYAGEDPEGEVLLEEEAPTEISQAEAAQEASGGEDPAETPGEGIPGEASGEEDPAETPGEEIQGEASGGADPAEAPGEEIQGEASGGADPAETPGEEIQGEASGGEDPAETPGEEIPGEASGEEDPAEPPAEEPRTAADCAADYAAFFGVETALEITYDFYVRLEGDKSEYRFLDPYGEEDTIFFAVGAGDTVPAYPYFVAEGELYAAFPLVLFGGTESAEPLLLTGVGAQNAMIVKTGQEETEGSPAAYKVTIRKDADDREETGRIAFALGGAFREELLVTKMASPEGKEIYTLQKTEDLSGFGIDAGTAFPVTVWDREAKEADARFPGSVGFSVASVDRGTVTKPVILEPEWEDETTEEPASEEEAGEEGTDEEGAASETVTDGQETDPQEEEKDPAASEELKDTETDGSAGTGTEEKEKDGTGEKDPSGAEKDKTEETDRPDSADEKQPADPEQKPAADAEPDAKEELTPAEDEIMLEDALASNYPTSRELWFCFSGTGQAPSNMSYYEYVERNGYDGSGGDRVYNEARLRGIVYNRSTGTLTISGPGAYTFDNSTNCIYRIYVVSEEARNLNIVFDYNVEMVYHATEDSTTAEGSYRNGAIIANATGGDLVIRSNNGASVVVKSRKTGENVNTVKKNNPIGIYCRGTLTIGGNINLTAEAYNNHNGDPWRYAWGIRSSKVVITDHARTHVQATATAKYDTDQTSAAIMATYVGRIGSVCISLGSYEDQTFLCNAYEGAVFSLRDDMLDDLESSIRFCTDSDGVGRSPQINCSWSEDGSFGRSMDGAGGQTFAAGERAGYTLRQTDDCHATYYSYNAPTIFNAEVKMAMPQLGAVPDAAANFTMLTTGIHLKEASYYYKALGSSSWTKVSPDSAEYRYNSIPVNPVAVKISYTVEADDGYSFARTVSATSGLELSGTFNGQAVTSQRWYPNDGPDAATFEVELDVSALRNPRTVQYVSITGIPAPTAGGKAWQIGSAASPGSEKGTFSGSYECTWAYFGNISSSSSIRTDWPYRQWWTDDRGQVMSKTDTFTANRQYTFHLLLQTNDGYAFGGGAYSGTSSLHLFINGYPCPTIADQYRYPGGAEYGQRFLHMTKTFTCPPAAVTEAEVFDVPEPVAGQQATMGTTLGSVAEGSPYTIAGARWYQGRDYTSSYGAQEDSLSSSASLYPFTGTFKTNTWYTYCVDLTPNSGYAFSAPNEGVVYSGFTAYVNGRQCCTQSGVLYVNTIRYTAPGTSWPSGKITLRYSFLTPASEGETVSDIRLTTAAFGLSSPASVGTSAASETEGVTTVGMENAPGYSQIGTNSNLTVLRGRTGVWLNGNDTLQQAYYQAVYSPGVAPTLTSQFAAGSTYSFYTVVDLGDKYFLFDGDGAMRTTVTVNGIPATLSPGNIASSSGNVTNYASHKALVTLTYTMPSDTSSCWLIVPSGAKVYRGPSSGTLMEKEFTRAGFDWYDFFYTMANTIRQGSWQAPEGEQFWKWECVTTHENFSLEFPYRTYVEIKASKIVKEDVVLRIRTAPEGNVPIDLSSRNGDIYIDGYQNNWGGESGDSSTYYDGTPKLRWPIVRWNNKTPNDTSDDITLIEGKDYTLSFADYLTDEPVASPTEYGSYQPVITGVGAYDGTRKCSYYYIYKAGITKAEITFAGVNMDYETDPATPWVYWTGAAQTPAFTLTFNGRTLTEGTDYTITGWMYNTDIGTNAAAHIAGLGNFNGWVSANFEIRAYDIGDAEVEEIPNRTFNGSYQKPKPVITYEGRTLTEDEHYRLNYSDNYDAGTAKITVTGLASGGWGGTREVTFTIDPLDLSDESITWDGIPAKQYTGDNITLGTVQGWRDSTRIYSGTAFDIDSYSNNLWPGQAKVKVTGKGNYTGSAEIPFDIYISLIDDSHLGISGVESSYPYTGAQIKPEPTVYISSNGHGTMTLTKGTAYSVAYGENIYAGTNSGWLRVETLDSKHYMGSRLVRFDITALDIADATVKAIPKQKYTGSPIEPVPTVTYGGKTLTEGTDYSVSYENNTDAAAATDTNAPAVILTGSGDSFSGTRKIPFTILPKEVEIPSLKASVFDYTGSMIIPYEEWWSGFTWGGDTSAAEIGKYTATATLDDTKNLVWSDKTTEPKEFPWEISSIHDIGWATVTGVVDKTWNGTAQTQDPTVTMNVGGTEVTLKEGTDYTLSYKSNINPGKLARVIVTGRGAYTGSKAVNFRIMFTDVPMSNHFSGDVYWGVDNGIGAGYGKGSGKYGAFGVGDTITRGQVVMFLWRAAGKPDTESDQQTFKDVPVSHSFYKAIQWAVENHITEGYTGTRKGLFGVNDNCTRGQIVTFLWRYVGRPAPAGTTQTFTDVPVDHPYYKAIQWASEKNITNGYSDGSFGVRKFCTRGHCMRFLNRLLS